jgi:deoxyribonuclease-4
MAKPLHFGPARVPSKESPEAAIALLLERGYSACEIDFEGRFWMDYDFAAEFGELARANDVVLSVHAPIAGFMGHAERGKKLNMAVGMLDHSAGIAKAAGAEVVVFHPGFLLGRTREEAIDSVVEQLGELRARLEGKDRAVPFGIEVMGRVRELGSIDDVVEISGRLGWVRPVVDFAHMHATSDGAYLTVEPFAEALAKADAVLEPGAPFHVHFSDIAFANRNETKHLPYGEGTLRAEPLAEALALFDRPATIVSESPDEESSQAIRAILGA